MALPVGIETFTGTTGPWADFQGNEIGSVTVSLTPIVPALNGVTVEVVHQPSGRVLLPRPITFTTSADGGAASITAPVVDATGLNVTNFSYRLSVSFPRGTQADSVPDRVLQITKAQALAAGGPIDLDLLADVPIIDGSAITTLAVTSVAGLRGDITAQQLSQAGVGGGGGSATTDASLLTSGTLANARLSSVPKTALATAVQTSLTAADTALQTAPVASVAGKTGVVSLVKGDVGLGSVDNTADTAKPVSTAQQTALNLKAPLASPTFTGTVAGVTAGMVGLGNVDNTSDVNKPVSTAQAAADALKTTTLVPTTAKTAAYTAAVGELAVMNVAGGGISLTLPTAPANKAQVGYRAVGATTAIPLTINRGGTDTFGDSGATTVTAPLSGESTTYQYDAPNTRWIALSNVKPLTALDSRYPPYAVRRRASGVAGRIVFIVDDALLTQKATATALEAVGGRLNFAIPWSSVGLNGSTMVAADITEMYNRGHQIMCHSLTHPNMTTQTAAQRQAEWDTSKANLEAITAVGAITDFVYPNNASNLTTQIEAYLRYKRCFTAQNAPTVVMPGENGLHIGRNTWSTTTHAQFLAAIKRIANTGETFVIFCHDTATANTSSAISVAMLAEATALASSLGVQWVRADEAIMGHEPLLDGGFESNDISLHAQTVKSGASTISIVTDTPDVGLSGTKSLQIVSDGVGQNILTVGGINTFVSRPSEEWSASCRIRQDKTSGAGGGHLLVRQWDEFGNSLGDFNSTPLTTVGTTAWTQVSFAITMNKLCRSISVRCMQSTMVGTTWFDHVHAAPTRMGLLG